jgi:hypothetical protein
VGQAVDRFTAAKRPAAKSSRQPIALAYFGCWIAMGFPIGFFPLACLGVDTF